ncbi:spherulation-specific family 4 protein [Allorhizocola rhizosphaerae]|uniref:spherulation-specific family 4 protein n=1 Tax=Allorhizocola rhizosphaerae TaxID=1872709 RepID=UPI0013C30472|nr:spherulation-specific family 4 protein [Allorhizocola rhizosphaerae]
MTPLLSLHQHPLIHPEAWATIESVGVGATVLLNIDTGPGSGMDPTWATATQRLMRAGVDMLGYVDLAYGARAIEQVRAELGRWAGYPIKGIFFDQAPTSPYSIGPVAVAVRAARRIGFDTLLVNPGRPADSIYRGLGAVLCTYEGTWDEYRGGELEGVRHGDAHLVYSVPPGQIRAAHELMRGRGARFGLATTEACMHPVYA